MFRQMYLVTKQTYNQLLEAEKSGCSQQVNHTEVQSGGKVEIHNNGGGGGCIKPQQDFSTSPSISTSRTGSELISSKESNQLSEMARMKSTPNREKMEKSQQPSESSPSQTRSNDSYSQRPQQSPPTDRPTPEYVLPLPTSLSSPPFQPAPPRPPPHPSTVRTASPQPQSRSQSFYPPDVEVIREPVRGVSDPSITSPEELTELLPEMAPINGKLDEVVVLMTDVIKQSRHNMTSFLEEARDENLKYVQLCKQSYTDIRNLITSDQYGNELADRLSERVRRMVEPCFTDVQRSIELQKSTVRQMENYMLTQQASGSEIATIKHGIVSDITSAFGPIQNQLMVEAQNFFSAEQNVWMERFMQLQAELREMNTAQFKSLHNEIEGSRAQWRQQVSHEQKLELEYQLNEWDRKTSQLSISYASDVQRYINEARRDMMEGFRKISEDLNSRHANEHDRRIKELQNFISGNILGLEERMNKYISTSTPSEALEGPPQQPVQSDRDALPAPPVTAALPPPPQQARLPPPPSRPALPAPSPPPAQSQAPQSQGLPPPPGSVEEDLSRVAALNRRPTENERTKIGKAAASASTRADQRRKRNRNENDEESVEKRISKRNMKKNQNGDYEYY